MKFSIKILAAAAFCAAVLPMSALQAQGSLDYVSGAADPQILVEEKLYSDGIVEYTPGAEMRITFTSDAPGPMVSIKAFNHDIRSGQFAGEFVDELGESTVLRGKFEATLPILLPNRRIAAGEIIDQSDVTQATMPLNAVAAHILRSERDIVGKEAKRILLPGRPIASHSVVEPRAVLRGDSVTISYANGILDLTAPGRALEEGAVDDFIRIVNLQSSKTITARVVQGGLVRVEPITLNIPSEVK